MKEGVKKSQSKYRAKCKQVLLVITPNDSDIAEKLASVPNKNGYIKELIRADISK